MAAVLAACLFVLALGAPAVATAAPRPGERVEKPVRSTAPNRKAVRLTYVRQYEPLPRSLGAPRRCDWISYLRFRDREGPRIPSRADAILVAMPGLLGGASSFDALARNTVHAAAGRGRSFEFWALDRRANCLEDRTGIDAAARSRDYRRALDYYWGGRKVRGRRFGGFPTDRQVPYLAEFGLAQTMRDEYAVIRRGVPDRGVRRRKVFCGGHSLGGLQTAAFASWDFDGDPRTTRDAGYSQCAGYFGLDTVVSNNFGGISRRGGLAGDALYTAESDGIRSGALPRFAASLPPVTPEVFEAAGVVALAAYHDPTRSRLLAELPHTRDIDQALRFLLSRDALAFASGRPDPRDYRLTNEALLGTVVDDNSESLPALQMSVGTYDGGPVVDKDVPTPNATRSLPLLGPELTRALANTLIVPGTSPTRLMIPARPKGPLYGWRDHDRVDAPGAPAQRDRLGQPFTSPASEVTDIQQLARSFFEGPANAWEQYFPMRLLMDVAAFSTGGRRGDLRAARHDEGPARRPYIELIGDEGGVNGQEDARIEPGAAPRRRVVLEGYNHVDVVTAARRLGTGERERASAELRDFVLEVIR